MSPKDKVLILHGWGGSDMPHWQAHLASHIVQNYGTVSFPLLDNCHFPSKNRWVKQTMSILKEFQPSIVVCHSLANTLWFWLCQEDGMPTVDKLIMVSPPSLSTQEKTIKTFFPCEMPRDIYAKETHIIVSDNDPWVKLEEVQALIQYYDTHSTILQNAGHINTDSGYGKWELIEKLVTKKTNGEIA